MPLTIETLQAIIVGAVCGAVLLGFVLANVIKIKRGKRLEKDSEERTVTLRYESNGGTAIEPQTGLPGNFMPLQVPKREGYIFAGWCKDPNLMERVTDYEFPATDCTYYAAWSQIIENEPSADTADTEETEETEETEDAEEKGVE